MEVYHQIPSPPYRTYSLLAALLLRPRPQRRDLLIGLLFPDIPEQAGRRRLSDRLWLLRRSLPELPLETNVQEVYLPSKARDIVPNYVLRGHRNHGDTESTEKSSKNSVFSVSPWLNLCSQTPKHIILDYVEFLMGRHLSCTTKYRVG
jgi:DNA-binding SARP family transcriptional activator